jgi:putative endonuclease
LYPAENTAAMTAAYVYLLRCDDGSLYCGWTVDVAKRVAAHEAGRASRYTASRKPLQLAAAWEVPTRTHARRLEARIKRLPRSAKLALAAGAPLDDAVRFALPGP